MIFEFFKRFCDPVQTTKATNPLQKLSIEFGNLINYLNSNGQVESTNALANGRHQKT